MIDSEKVYHLQRLLEAMIDLRKSQVAGGGSLDKQSVSKVIADTANKIFEELEQ